MGPRDVRVLLLYPPAQTAPGAVCKPNGSLAYPNLAGALRVARAVESGVLSINSHSSVHLEAPFGGFKQSGLGRDLGMNALEGYTELKNIYIGS